MNPPTSPPDRLDRRGWAALLVLCGALFLDGLDVSMVGIALPSIDADLGMSTTSLQWVVSGYVLGYGGFLLLGGRTADLVGRRKVLLIGLSVFAAASLLGAFVDSPGLLIASRFIKGVAAAFTAPAALSIITTTFPEGPKRNKALAVFTATGASGFSFGLVLGGILTSADWRWTFLLPVPVALLLLAIAPRVLPDDAPAERIRGRFDIAGAALVTSATMALVYGITGATDAGWTSAQTIIALLAAVGLLTSFLIVEKRVEQPLVRLGIFKMPSLTGANFAAMAVLGCYIGFQFIGTLYMQDLLGWSALETALAFLPGGLVVAFGSPHTGKLVDRVGTGPVIAGGLISFVAAYGLFLGIDMTPTYAWAILPTMLLIGVGFALAYPAVNMAATDGIEDHEQGLASGLVQASFQIGGALVLSIVTAVVSSQAGNTSNPERVLDAFQPGLAVVTGVAALGLLSAVTTMVLLRRRAALAGAGAV